MKTSTRCCKSRTLVPGLTLVEVLAGLALMGTLLVTMIVLKSRFTHQLVGSDKQLNGAAAADALLTDWWPNPAELPIGHSGTVQSSPSLHWRTSLVINDTVTHFGGKVVRLEITSESNVVATVEVILPLEVRREE